MLDSEGVGLNIDVLTPPTTSKKWQKKGTNTHTDTQNCLLYNSKIILEFTLFKLKFRILLLYVSSF